MYLVLVIVPVRTVLMDNRRYWMTFIIPARPVLLPGLQAMIVVTPDTFTLRPAKYKDCDTILTVSGREYHVVLDTVVRANVEATGDIV